ncbi:MAG: D-alanyl-D-alanine carboxypeptidase/D-alanyl-D-alanine-endopeptidase [bacterium]|nr:D-alanyl-D-alanine carboxypeptidase/D-alanyl-D-alanine-endopeptidase [bacterium]
MTIVLSSSRFPDRMLGGFPVIRCVLVLFLLFGASPVLFAADESASGSFDDYVESVISENTFRGASWSIAFYSLSGDSLVYEYDGDRLLIPASLTKLFVTAAALDALGADFQFTTPCFRDGPLLDSGELQGDLIVQAGGDPTPEIKSAKYFHAPALRAWADSLKDRGVRGISGNLVLRVWPYRLESAAAGWEMGDVNAGFAPPLDGFGFNSNVCHLGIFPSETVDGAPRFTVDPDYAPLSVRSNVVTSNADSSPMIEMWSLPRDTSISVVGEIPVHDDGEFLWVPMQDPARYFGCALRDALEQRGIAIGGDIVVDRSSFGPPSGEPFYVHCSPPLTQLVTLINKDSDNYAAEYLLAAVGAAETGSPERRHGVKALMSFAARCGVESKEMHLEDGCGLSRKNVVSARAITRFLRAMHRHPHSAAFESSLSIAGVDGTLSHRLSMPLTARRVIGKTGSMSHVSGVAGYAETLSGDTMAFAVLCNHFQCTLPHVRGAQDHLIEQFLKTYP